MNHPYKKTSGGWGAKLGNALRGVKCGVQGESSFLVHVPAALAVVGAAAWLRLDPVRWSLLVICIFTVLTAELFNSSLERLAKAVDTNENPHLRDALDVASGAVLTAAVGAAIVGAIILLPALWQAVGRLAV